MSYIWDNKAYLIFLQKTCCFSFLAYPWLSLYPNMHFCCDWIRVNRPLHNVCFFWWPVRLFASPISVIYRAGFAVSWLDWLARTPGAGPKPPWAFGGGQHGHMSALKCVTGCTGWGSERKEKHYRVSKQAGEMLWFNGGLGWSSGKHVMPHVNKFLSQHGLHSRKPNANCLALFHSIIKYRTRHLIT